MDDLFNNYGSNYDYVDNTDFINTKSNIISGPEPHSYWNHSKDDENPINREEGPLPILGNIGVLLKEQKSGNFSNCDHTKLVGGSPDCTNNFVPDEFTKSNTCTGNCKLGALERYGDTSFGLIDGIKTDSYILSSMSNTRAMNTNKKSNEYKEYSFVPQLTNTDSVGLRSLPENRVWLPK